MGFGWKDALNFLPPVRAYEYGKDSYNDFKHGDITGGFENGGLAIGNVAPPTATYFESAAVIDSLTGGSLSDLTGQAASSLGGSGTPNPLAHDPTSNPLGINLPVSKWLGYLKWALIIGGVIFLLIIILVILIRV